MVLLFLMFLVAFLRPLGNPMTTTATAAYVRGSVVNGFLQGYNTMDVLAGLAFWVTVVTAVRQMGQKRAGAVSKVVAKSGFLAMAGVALIYLLLIVVGAMSLGRFKLSADGGVAFTQLVNYYGAPLAKRS